MATPKRISATQKKKRLLQLRDAQRRRRERLKEESQHFVQIILPEGVLVRLRQIAAETGETLQHVIARLVEGSLDIPNLEKSGGNGSKIEPPEPAKIEETATLVPESVKATKPVNQLDLF